MPDVFMEQNSYRMKDACWTLADSTHALSGPLWQPKAIYEKKLELMLYSDCSDVSSSRLGNLLLVQSSLHVHLLLDKMPKFEILSNNMFNRAFCSTKYPSVR